MRKLFDNESIIKESKDKEVVLTNRRIWKEDNINGESVYQSMMLSKVSSVQCITEEVTVLLLVSVVFALAGLYLFFSGLQQIAMICGVGFVVFLIFYFFTRRSVVIIASSGAKLKISLKGFKKEAVAQFVYEVEAAVNSLSSTQ